MKVGTFGSCSVGKQEGSKNDSIEGTQVGFGVGTIEVKGLVVESVDGYTGIVGE